MSTTKLAATLFAVTSLLGSSCGSGREPEPEPFDSVSSGSTSDGGRGLGPDITSLAILRRTVGQSPELSTECYTFYPNGEVELRHSGLPKVNDVGQYSGDDSGGEIIWESGRVAASVQWDIPNAKGTVDGAKGDIIDTCLQ